MSNDRTYKFTLNGNSPSSVWIAGAKGKAAGLEEDMALYDKGTPNYSQWVLGWKAYDTFTELQKAQVLLHGYTLPQAARKRRYQMDISLVELGKKVGMSSGTINGFELGKLCPSDKPMWERYFTYLGFTDDEFHRLLALMKSDHLQVLYEQKKKKVKVKA